MAVSQKSLQDRAYRLALLQSKKLEPAKLFASQAFVGSYRAALEAVLDNKADVAGVFTFTAGVPGGTFSSPTSAIGLSDASHAPRISGTVVS